MKTALIAMATAAALIFTSQANAAPPVKNIVLVHGAFADGSSWSKVVPILQAKGYNVTAIQHPMNTLADDVAATKRALALQNGPAILVGHSWGGAVITEAGNDPKVAALVYVAAFGPDVGETLNGLGKGQPPMPAIAALQVDKEGWGSLPTDAVLKYFVQDLPKAEGLVVAATQGPAHVTLFDTKLTTAAWKSKPSWFVVAKRDGTIAPDAERFFAKRMNATTIELDSDHVAMLSKPNEVANVIMEAAAKAPH
ncbi:MAG: alpha/beta hydrolase [Alphaproteobacteria bacterium]|nr:alpha/beta hydrolase [Alphaproteobacteria bacterium]